MALKPESHVLPCEWAGDPLWPNWRISTSYTYQFSFLLSYMQVSTANTWDLISSPAESGVLGF